MPTIDKLMNISFQSERNPTAEYAYTIWKEEDFPLEWEWECTFPFYINTGRTCKHHFAIKILRGMFHPAPLNEIF